MPKIIDFLLIDRRAKRMKDIARLSRSLGETCGTFAARARRTLRDHIGSFTNPATAFKNMLNPRPIQFSGSALSLRLGNKRETAICISFVCTAIYHLMKFGSGAAPPTGYTKICQFFSWSEQGSNWNFGNGFRHSYIR
jgi:hypothetical protein